MDFSVIFERYGRSKWFRRGLARRGLTGLGLALGVTAWAHAQPLSSPPAGTVAGLGDTPPPAWVAQRDELDRQAAWLEHWRAQQCRTPDPAAEAAEAADNPPAPARAANPDPGAGFSSQAPGGPSAQLAVFLAEAASLRTGWDQLAQQLTGRLGRLEKLWQERFVLAQCPSRYGAQPPCRANVATREAIQQLRRQGSEAWQGSTRRLTLFQTVAQQDGACIGALTLDQWLRKEREHLQQSGEWLGGEAQRLQALR